MCVWESLHGASCRYTPAQRGVRGRQRPYRILQCQKACDILPRAYGQLSPASPPAGEGQAETRHPRSQLAIPPRAPVAPPARCVCIPVRCRAKTPAHPAKDEGKRRIREPSPSHRDSATPGHPREHDRARPRCTATRANEGDRLSAPSTLSIGWWASIRRRFMASRAPRYGSATAHTPSSTAMHEEASPPHPASSWPSAAGVQAPRGTMVC
jgi:hypothetical protein